MSTAISPSMLHAMTAGQHGGATSASHGGQHDKIETQAQKWVAQTFFGTLMKEVRNDPFRSKMMDGGQGGAAFGQMYDQEMASRMSRGVGKKLVNSITRRLEAKKGYAAQQKAKHSRGDATSDIARSLAATASGGLSN